MATKNVICNSSRFLKFYCLYIICVFVNFLANSAPVSILKKSFLNFCASNVHLLLFSNFTPEMDPGSARLGSSLDHGLD